MTEQARTIRESLVRARKITALGRYTEARSRKSGRPIDSTSMQGELVTPPWQPWHGTPLTRVPGGASEKLDKSGEKPFHWAEAGPGSDCDGRESPIGRAREDFAGVSCGSGNRDWGLSRMSRNSHAIRCASRGCTCSNRLAAPAHPSSDAAPRRGKHGERLLRELSAVERYHALRDRRDRSLIRSSA